MIKKIFRAQPTGEHPGRVYCPICTHTVNAQVVTAGKTIRVKPGQKCSRCSSSLDPGVVISMPHAA